LQTLLKFFSKYTILDLFRWLRLDISKRILEKCKLNEEIYLWLRGYLREAKDKVWYLIAESKNDKHERFIHHRFSVDNLYMIHKYLIEAMIGSFKIATTTNKMIQNAILIDMFL